MGIVRPTMGRQFRPASATFIHLCLSTTLQSPPSKNQFFTFPNSNESFIREKGLFAPEGHRGRKYYKLQSLLEAFKTNIQSIVLLRMHPTLFWS